MLTIVSFRHRHDDRAILLALGRATNAARPGLFEDADFKPRRRGFRCEVAASDDWQDHVQRMLDLLETCGPMFARAAQTGVVVTFDVAIWSEDRVAQDRVRLVLPPSLMVALGACGALFLVSDYVGPGEGVERDDD